MIDGLFGHSQFGLIICCIERSVDVLVRSLNSKCRRTRTHHFKNAIGDRLISLAIDLDGVSCGVIRKCAKRKKSGVCEIEGLLSKIINRGLNVFLLLKGRAFLLTLDLIFEINVVSFNLVENRIRIKYSLFFGFLHLFCFTMSFLSSKKLFTSNVGLILLIFRVGGK